MTTTDEDRIVAERDAAHGGLPVARQEDLPEEYRDMAMTPDQFLKRRRALILVVKEQLIEAEYKNGKILRVNDYYKIPGSDTFALSRPGAGKLSDIYRIKPIDQQTDKHVYEKDHVMYRIRVYVGRSGMVQGVAAGSCSTSEKRFTSYKSRKKYGAVYKNNGTRDTPDWVEVEPPDLRAADHDVLTMSAKRGYVNAIIDALSAHEILQVAEEYQDIEDIPEAEFEDITERPDPIPESNGGPTPEQLMKLGSLVSKSCFTDDERNQLKDWLNTSEATKEAVDDQIVRLEERVEVWRAKKVGPIRA